MTKSTEIIFNGMGRSEFIEKSVLKHIHHVEKHYSDIVSWHIAVSAPHKSRRHGNQFELNIRACLPGEEIVVSHSPGDRNTHSDMRPVIRDAFHAFESQLEKRKGRKHHSHRTALPPQVNPGPFAVDLDNDD